MLEVLMYLATGILLLLPVMALFVVFLDSYEVSDDS